MCISSNALKYEVDFIWHKDKKNTLKKYGAKITELNSDVLNKNVWNKDCIEERAKRLSKSVINIFSYPVAEQYISFKDPRYKEYGCEDENEATNKSIEYFILRGEKIYVSSFADMLRIIIKTLYDEDSTPIEEMAHDNKRLIDWSKKVIFSYEQNKERRQYILEDSDIYVTEGFPASQIILVIRVLLESYGIDFGEFVYSARDTKSSEKIEEYAED